MRKQNFRVPGTVPRVQLYRLRGYLGTGLTVHVLLRKSHFNLFYNC